MRVVAAGVNYRTAPVAIRERVAIDNDRAPGVLRYLVGHTGVAGAAVLSTCNRTEFYLTVPDDELADEVVPRLGRYLDSEGKNVEGYLVGYQGDDALRHIFTVASGLNSQVLGETQVLGQFKRAHRIALDSGCLDAQLDFVLRRGVAVAKQIHTRKLVDDVRGMAGVAVDALRAHGAGRVIVIGAGETAASVVGLLVREGIVVSIAARGESGQTLATSYGIDCVHVSALRDVEDVDCIVSCTNSPEHVVEWEVVGEIQARRRSQNLLLIDMAVPRDIDPRAGEISGVTLIDIDTLDAGARSETAGENVAQARRLIDAEVSATTEVLRHRNSAGRAIAALGTWAEELRAAEVGRSFERMPELTAEQRERVESLSRTLINRVLHNPIAALREAGDEPQLALAILNAFDLGAMSAGNVDVELPGTSVKGVRPEEAIPAR